LSRDIQTDQAFLSIDLFDEKKTKRGKPNGIGALIEGPGFTKLEKWL
jgi:hypothetical protein